MDTIGLIYTNQIVNTDDNEAYYTCESCGIELNGEDVDAVHAGSNKANGEFAPCPACGSENPIDRG